MAARAVVPLPMNGSSTTPSGGRGTGCSRKGGLIGERSRVPVLEPRAVTAGGVVPDDASALRRLHDLRLVRVRAAVRKSFRARERPASVPAEHLQPGLVEVGGPVPLQ